MLRGAIGFSGRLDKITLHPAVRRWPIRLDLIPLLRLPTICSSFSLTDKEKTFLVQWVHLQHAAFELRSFVYSQSLFICNENTKRIRFWKIGTNISWKSLCNNQGNATRSYLPFIGTISLPYFDLNVTKVEKRTRTTRHNMCFNKFILQINEFHLLPINNKTCIVTHSYLNRRTEQASCRFK